MNCIANHRFHISSNCRIKCSRVRGVGKGSQDGITKEWLLEQRVCRSCSGIGYATKSSDESDTRGNAGQFPCDKKHEYSISPAHHENEFCISNMCTDCPINV